MSDRFAKTQIRVMMRMTAKAAYRRAPSLKGLSHRDCLQRYIEYTTGLITEMDEAERAAFRANMYERAFAVGRGLGSLPGLKSDPARARLIRRLYRNIGISIEVNIEGKLPGEIIVPTCAFSKSYTPAMCHVMSGMDAGIICGVFDGGSLTFEQRLTEGCPACRALYRR